MLYLNRQEWIILDPLAWSVSSPTADQGVASSISAFSHTLVEIDHEIILTSFSPFRWFKKGCCQYVHKVLVNCLVNLAQEKGWWDELTVSTWP